MTVRPSTLGSAGSYVCNVKNKIAPSSIANEVPLSGRTPFRSSAHSCLDDRELQRNGLSCRGQHHPQNSSFCAETRKKYFTEPNVRADHCNFAQVDQSFFTENVARNGLKSHMFAKKCSVLLYERQLAGGVYLLTLRYAVMQDHCIRCWELSLVIEPLSKWPKFHTSPLMVIARGPGRDRRGGASGPVGGRIVGQI